MQCHSFVNNLTQIFSEVCALFYTSLGHNWSNFAATAAAGVMKWRALGF